MTPHPTVKTHAQTSGRPKTLGRPPKFSGPSRPVTVTLPETTLQALKSIHPDCGQAIVKLTEAELRRTRTGAGLPPVEVVEMAANTGVILVGPSKALRRIPFLHLIEVARGRFLLALDPGHGFHDLEIAISDVLDETSAAEAKERDLLDRLLLAIRQVRKAEKVSMAEILFVNPDETLEK
jgi:hypothetical protein